MLPAQWSSKSLEETSLDEWRKVMSVNLDAIFIGAKAVLPLMRKSAESTPQGARSSTCRQFRELSAFLPWPAYGASKGAVRQFTKSMALDFARRGYRIRVNSVHPGLIDTEMAQQLFEGRVRTGVSGDLEQARKSWIDSYPIGPHRQPRRRCGDRAVSGVRRFGIHDGSELTVDGGATAQ